MRFPRKAIVLGAAAYATIGVRRFVADAAEFSYKLGTEWPADHPIAVHLAEAAAKINQESAGRLEIRFFPDSALGGTAEMVSQVRLGALEFSCNGDNVIATASPTAGLSGIPFAFSDHRDAWNAMDGALGKFVRAAAAKANILVFDREFDGGFRQISNGVRPIRVPDDLRGLKIRVPVAPVSTATFKALGAEPTGIDGSQMYVACQTHLVDGTDLPLPSLNTFKMYEVQKYVSITNHFWTGCSAYANPAAFQRLPGNVRDIVERNFYTAANNSRTTMVKLDKSIEASLTSHGMIFNQADIPAFKRTIRNAGLYTQWRDQYGLEAWALLERVAGKLT